VTFKMPVCNRVEPHEQHGAPLPGGGEWLCFGEGNPSKASLNPQEIRLRLAESLLAGGGEVDEGALGLLNTFAVWAEHGPDETQIREWAIAELEQQRDEAREMVASQVRAMAQLAQERCPDPALHDSSRHMGDEIFDLKGALRAVTAERDDYASRLKATDQAWTRLIAAERDDLGLQIDTLAGWITENIPGEPSRSEGAVATAIRVMAALKAELLETHADLEASRAREQIAQERIAELKRQRDATRADAEERLTEVLAWATCQCKPEWTERGMHASDCRQEEIRAILTGDQVDGDHDGIDWGAHPSGGDRRIFVAEQGCDDCSVEPGETHRYAACPGNERDRMRIDEEIRAVLAGNQGEEA